MSLSGDIVVINDNVLVFFLIIWTLKIQEQFCFKAH